MDEPIYRMLGLCMKAGRLLSGNEQVSEGLKKGQGVLLIVTEDSSPRTKDEYIKAAERYHISSKIFGEKERRFFDGPFPEPDQKEKAYG